MEARTPAVAVIARPGASLRPCLEALERAGVGAPLSVPIGPDGSAMARNRALAACDTEVLALVEDDVTVEPGWFEALVASWMRADGALVCVGGPLRATFPRGRPGWLSDDLLDTFATQVLGDEPVAVDARERTFHGGNVSFRTSALRQSAASGPPADTRMDATGSVRSMRPSTSWRARAGGQRTRRKPAPCG